MTAHVDPSSARGALGLAARPARRQQAPLRNPSIVGWCVYSHSGEFAPSFEDFRLPGRGLDLSFVRAYRSSRAHEIGPLGRGWSLNLVKTLHRDGDDLVYDDGSGSLHRFVHADGGYVAPPGLYAVLRAERDELVLLQRFGTQARFQRPELGGELLAVEDRNGNRIQFARNAGERRIRDTFGRTLVLTSGAGDLVEAATDEAGRRWAFSYDDRQRLVRVTGPATAGFPDGAAVGYGYDTGDRLVSITNARGATWLENRYRDDQVVEQRHGAGSARFEYGQAGRTRCHQANGGLLDIEHDEAGHAVARTLLVGRTAFHAADVEKVDGDVVPVTTLAKYDAAGEVVHVRLPSGRETRWTYSQDDADARNRGNVVEVVGLPASAVDTPASELRTRLAYEPRFQQVTSRTDARGATTSYEYDAHGNLVVVTYPPVSVQPVGSDLGAAGAVDRALSARASYNRLGQLVASTDTGGATTEYEYYSTGDPFGVGGRSGRKSGGGRLAKIVRHAGRTRLVTGYAYDTFGHLAATIDGNGNATHIRCDPLGRVESVVGREPTNRIDYAYDADSNPIEAVQAFTRPVGQSTTAATLREQREFDEVGNLVARTIAGGESAVTERFVRDDCGRVERAIQPLGETTEYLYDERDLVIEKRLGVGTKSVHTERFAYDLDGTPRSHTDGDGNTMLHHVDEFGRYAGFTDPTGTTKEQIRDEAGNVVRVTVADAQKRLLMEAQYSYDSWRRVVRADRAWIGAEAGVSLGKSSWDGRDGVVSTITEYGDNGLPAKLWDETGNIVEVHWDGARRLSTIGDASGRTLALDYDAGGNLTGVRESGGGVETFERRTYDAMGRLTTRERDGGTSIRVVHNELGAVVGYTAPSGLEIRHTLDELGRRDGHHYEVDGQQVSRSFEHDANYRLQAYVDAAGNRTTYEYDALGRQSGVVYPDGASVRVERDARGNVVRSVHQDGSVTTSAYDAAGRLASVRDGTSTIEYEHDGGGRLVTARRGKDELQREWDSLSRLHTERHQSRAVRYVHDAAGNLTEIAYPGGDAFRRTYDAGRRVTSVVRGDGRLVATFAYDGLNRLARATLGETLEATYAYDAQQRLTSIEYRSTKDGTLVDGFRYAYDDAGRMTREAQLRSGASFGERYEFDGGGRPLRATYGVADLDDPTSAFEQQTSYTYFAEGSWHTRRDVDGQGTILSERDGAVDALNRCVRFGDVSFEYDARGNRTRKSSKRRGSCQYAYDEADRVAKVECRDDAGRLQRTIAYRYDPIGRLVAKVVTDASGKATETEYVWTGFLLAEEYDDGRLARTYVHGVGSTPAMLSTYEGERADYIYTFNGRGLASGLARSDDPNAFAERYGYELTGAYFPTEIDGVAVALPARDSTASGLDNSLLGGDSFGSVLGDWANGTLAGFGGGQMDPTIASALNSLGDVAGKGHGSVTSALAAQLSDMLDAIGLGGAAKGGATAAPAGGSTSPDIPAGGPNWKLYADGDDADGGTKDGGTKDGGTKDGGDKGGGATDGGTKDGGTKDGGDKSGGQPADAPKKDPDLTPAPKDSSDPGGLKGGAGGGATDGGTGLMDKLGKTLDSIPLTGGSTQGGGYYGGLKGKWYTDPDAGGGSVTVMPSPDELEARFNQLKQPVNPNGGPDTGQVDASSPPQAHGGIDPTVALLDPDAAPTGVLGPPPVNTGPIDYAPGFGPGAPGGNPGAGGGQPGGDTSGLAGGDRFP